MIFSGFCQGLNTSKPRFQLAMVKDNRPIFDDDLVIQYRGVYDYDGLMDLIRGYYAKIKMDKLDEPKFKYKNGSGGAEVEFKFVADRKVTHYIKVYLNVSGHLWDVKQEEIMINGVKKKMTRGKLELTMNGSYDVDYAKGFDGKKALDKWMQKKLDDPPGGLQFGDNKMTGEKFMEKVIITLHTEIKKFLNMTCT